VKEFTKVNEVEPDTLLRPKKNYKKIQHITQVMNTIRITAINTNGLLYPIRQAMLENDIRLHEMDIIRLQEVTQQLTTPFSGYDIHYNIGTTLRSTAFITRNTLNITNLSRLPSGRAIAAHAK
jgi:exonuclease III